MQNNNYYYGQYVDSSRNVPDPQSVGASQKENQSHPQPALFCYSSSPTYSLSVPEGYDGGTTVVSPSDSTAGIRSELYESCAQPELRHSSELALTPHTAFHTVDDVRGSTTFSPVAPASSSPHSSPAYQQTHEQLAITVIPGWDPHYNSGFQFPEHTQMVFRGAANIQILEEQPPEPGPWGDGGDPNGHVPYVFTPPKPVKGRMRSNARESKPEPIQIRAIGESFTSETTVSRRRSSKASGTRAKGKRQSTANDLSSPIRQPAISPTITLASDENDDFGSNQGTSVQRGHSTAARARHNKVEQKYRHRLNYHFEQLLSVLPNTVNESCRQSGGASGNGASGNASFPQGHGFSPVNGRSGDIVSRERERRVSKGEVLDRARLHIQTLQDDGSRLEAENAELKQIWVEYCRAHEGAQRREYHGPGSGPGSGQHSPITGAEK